jgi:diaminopimelate decarboxylase
MLAERLNLFPISTRIENDQLTVGGRSLAGLAQEFGTPLYLFDQATLDDSVAQYRRALQAYYPGPSNLTYAGKAYLSTAMAQWTQRHGLWLDCTGRTEIEIAALAGVPRRHILVHGVNKSPADLAYALHHAGTVVVDNLAEIEKIEQLTAHPLQAPQGYQLWLRLRPGVAVDTHRYTQTGQETSKFGMSADEFRQAVSRCLAHRLPLTGLHFHQGSHFHDPQPLIPAIDAALALLADLHREFNWTAQYFSPGGGWGVPYHEDDLLHLPLVDYVRLVGEQLSEGLNRRGLPLPRLHLEPGRSLAARAGVALYRVDGVKVSGGRRWLLLDGGMADNLRPALYGARYSALPALNPQRPPVGPAWLGGPFCESGDILIQDLPMPDIQPGEWLAVPVSGAYHLAMGSNYNGACKPAVVWLANGQANLVQRRETVDDLLRRDVPLPTVS